jgi:peptide/nickel transport system permease protein
MRRFDPRRDLPFALGVALLAFILLLAIIGPVIINTDPNAINTAARFKGPSLEHLLGTDDLGRDTFSRIVHGSRTTLMIAGAAVSLTTIIGTVVGVVSGFFGSIVDLVISRVTDVFFAIPSLLVAIGIVAVLGRGAGSTILAIGFAYWPFYARLVRGAVVGVRSRSFVEASTVLGASPLRLIRYDVIPTIIPIILIQSSIFIGFAILDEATLGFLGLGVQPPEPSWGSLLSNSVPLLRIAPTLALIAGIPVILSVFAANLVGDGLRGILDPRRVAR